MKRLESKRFWLTGGVVVAVLIIAVGWFGFIGPELSSASSLRSQTAATQQQNTALQLKVDTLRVKSARLPQYAASLKAALAALPYDSGLPAFTRQIAAQAADHKVLLKGVTVGSVSPVIAAPLTTPSPTDTATAGATSAATTPTTASTSAGSLFSVQITLQSSGSLAGQLAFLNAVRTTGPRRALVNSTQLAPGAHAKRHSIDDSASFTTQLTVFSAPRTPAQIAQLRALLTGKIGN